MICLGVECYSFYTAEVEGAGFLNRLVHTFQTAWHDTPEHNDYSGTVKCWIGCQVIKSSYLWTIFISVEWNLYVYYISVYKADLCLLKTCLSVTDWVRSRLPVCELSSVQTLHALFWKSNYIYVCWGTFSSSKVGSIYTYIRRWKWENLLCKYDIVYNNTNSMEQGSPWKVNCILI